MTLGEAAAKEPTILVRIERNSKPHTHPNPQPPTPPPLIKDEAAQKPKRAIYVSLISGEGYTNFPSILSTIVFLYRYLLSSALRSNEIGRKMKKESKKKKH